SRAPRTTEPSTLSLHDALPICTTRYVTPAPSMLAPAYDSALPVTATMSLIAGASAGGSSVTSKRGRLYSSTENEVEPWPLRIVIDRKSTRLNSSHVKISYAVFC